MATSHAASQATPEPSGYRKALALAREYFGAEGEAAVQREGPAIVRTAETAAARAGRAGVLGWVILAAALTRVAALRQPPADLIGYLCRLAVSYATTGLPAGPVSGRVDPAARRRQAEAQRRRDEARALLRDIMARGVTFHVEGETVQLDVPENVRKYEWPRLRDLKPEILAILREGPGTAPPGVT